MISTRDAQALPKGVDRVDAELSIAGISGPRVPLDQVDADIAVMDTGVQEDHLDLNVFKCLTFDWLTAGIAKGPGIAGWAGSPGCEDKTGHGTGVAGVAAAKNNDEGVVGTAPGARIWALKIWSSNTNCPGSYELAAYNYAGS